MPTCQQKALVVVSMVADIQEMITRQRPPIVTLQPRWWQPARGCLKINFDGAFVQETNVGAWGFVVRDHEGQPVLAGAGNLVMIHNALLAELMHANMRRKLQLTLAYLGLYWRQTQAN